MSCLSNQDQSHILYIIPSPPSTPRDSLPLAINRLLLCKLWTYLSIFTQSFFLPASQLLPWTLFPFLLSLDSWGKHTHAYSLSWLPLPSLGSYTFQAGWARAEPMLSGPSRTIKSPLGCRRSWAVCAGSFLVMLSHWTEFQESLWYLWPNFIFKGYSKNWDHVWFSGLFWKLYFCRSLLLLEEGQRMVHAPICDFIRIFKTQECLSGDGQEMEDSLCLISYPRIMC